jgi:hypothetical protein
MTTRLITRVQYDASHFEHVMLQLLWKTYWSYSVLAFCSALHIVCPCTHLQILESQFHLNLVCPSIYPFLGYVTANFFILHNYEMEDEIICFIIFMIENYGIIYIIAAWETILVEPLSSQMKHLILIIIIRDKMYCLALINTSRAGWK